MSQTNPTSAPRSDLSGTGGEQHDHDIPIAFVQGVQDAFDVPVTGGEVVNSNTTTDIGVDELDIVKLRDDVGWAERANGEDSKGFCKLTVPECNANGRLFNSGKLVITGSTAAEEIIELYRSVHRRLRAWGIETEYHTIDVTNIVVNFDSDDGKIDQSVDLIDVSICCEAIEYEPEQFVGAVFRNEFGGTCLLFDSGATVVQGAQSTREAIKQKEELFNTLDEYDLIG